MSKSSQSSHQFFDLNEQSEANEGLFNSIRTWAIKNPYASMFFAFLLIAAGVATDLITEDAHSIYYSALSHFMIIAGEAVFVMFFLHVYIEDLNAKSHQDSITYLISSLTGNMQDEVNALMTDFRTQGNDTAKKLKKDLFSAILQDQMPRKFVKRILKAGFFNSNILREDLQVKYKIKLENDELIIINELVFKVCYVSGQDETLAYDMPFTLSDTPEVSYEFSKANYQLWEPNQKTKHLDKDKDFKKNGGKGEQMNDEFSLQNPIELKKNRPIKVQQRFIARHKKFSAANAMQDIFYVNHHTLNVKISFKLPEGLAVDVFPTFPKSLLGGRETDTFSDTIKYNKIPFLAPGQGFLFSIKKDVPDVVV